MKEVEAKSKWCPFTKLNMCVASHCMAWIWDSSGHFTPSGMSEFVKSTTEGSCGMAREPRGNDKE